MFSQVKKWLFFRPQPSGDMSAVIKKNLAQRTRNIYDPSSEKPFRISRSKLELFLECPRCFYVDRRLGVGRPDIPAFTLNIAVDELLKREFDQYRIQQIPHPICLKENLDLVPYAHPNLNAWRNSLHEGVQYRVPNTNIIVCGGIDDLWINLATQEIYVVDYKATSKREEITLDGEWQERLKRQVEIYQWLLRKNGLKVSDTAYFVYCNACKDMPDFGNQLIFDSKLISHEGDAFWVEQTVMQAYDCLQSPNQPTGNDDCGYCQYHEAVKKHAV